MYRLVVIPSLIALAACSSAPKPPVVSGLDRHAVNSPETAEMMALRIQLSQVEDQLRQEQSRPVISPAIFQSVPAFSQTFSAKFPYNGTKFRLSSSDRARLLALLPTARRIEVRGRTDGYRPSSADERVALNRALAAQRFLIGQGVPPAIISVNYVSAGNYIADNFSASGRSLNRRVDIEIFNQQGSL
ncbi:OmpA family protein [Microvirgula aerodenitrificans]|uniref:OmpA family protein n=1 Tax=Microvirgula aerodenitrificans TaxID=57480 RepID=UPI00248D4383|nr:OmpA family protein [Microvirgula aerodenitrificans]